VLEIGCGTGQATLPLAHLGCTIVAVELSTDMAAVARRNLAQFSNVTVVASAFEDWQSPSGTFDAVLSATAFHWIDPDIRMVKAADLLRPGGALGVISTHHVAGGTGTFFADVQRCYERFDPATPPGLQLSTGDETPEETTEFNQSARFGPVEFRRYKWQHTYTTREYLNLLMTYSGHRAMTPQARSGLFTCIDSVFAAMRAGARGYLLKGAEQDEIVRAIRAAAAGEAIFGPEIAQRVIAHFASGSGSTAGAFPSLTEREREVLEMVAAGKGNATIAHELMISLKTVRNHVSNVFTKLQVSDRSQAIIKAREAGLGGA